MTRPPARRGERGIALVAVLWAVVLLALIAGSFTTATRTGTRLAHNAVERAEARALAEAGVHRALAALRAGTTADGLAAAGDLPDPAAGAAGDGAALSSPAWRADGTIRNWAFAGGEVLLSLEDEQGKIDLNAAPEALLAGLFAALGLDGGAAAALAGAIADFRDADDAARPDGAEAADYRAAGLAHGPKNAPFQAVDELRRVVGMSPALYARAAPALTVYSGHPGIDPWMAPRLALTALPGVDSATVETVLARRADADAAAMIDLLGQSGHLTRTRGRVYTVRAEARTLGGAVFVREAVVRLAGAADRRFEIYAWRQGTRARPPGDGD